MEAEKRKIIKLMRTKGLTLPEAAMKTGVATTRAFLWSVRDKDFSRAVTAIQLIRAIDFILLWGDVALEAANGVRELSEADCECIELAQS